MRDLFDLYPRTLRERLPRIAIPLAGDDPDVVLDVQAAVEQAWENRGYADRLDYRTPCRPPLSRADQAWAAQLIKKGRAGARAAKRPLRK